MPQEPGMPPLSVSEWEERGAAWQPCDWRRGLLVFSDDPVEQAWRGAQEKGEDELDEDERSPTAANAAH